MLLHHPLHKFGFLNFLLISGKGNKERLVPISKYTRGTVDKYLSIRNYFIAKNNKDFANYTIELFKNY